MKLQHFETPVDKINTAKVLSFLFVLLLLFAQSCKKPQPLNPEEENNNPTNEIDASLISLKSKVLLPQGSSLKINDLTFVTDLDHEY